MKTNYICKTCGIQFAASDKPPEYCPICEDEHQYVNPAGQKWTTLKELRAYHHNFFKTHEAHLIGIGTEPQLAIGQRALLVQTKAGNVLWDYTALLDETTITLVDALGGISAIAISHPHLCSTLVEWSLAFDNAHIYWHAADKDWVMRPNPAFVFWDGDTNPVIEGVTLYRCGGHFPGSSVLHWTDGAQGHGVLLTSDTIGVAEDRRYASFMYSYPNQIPLPNRDIKHIVDTVSPLTFDRIYGGWFQSVISDGAKNAVIRSARRYLKVNSRWGNDAP